jgi:hypothetical protein
MSLPVPAFTTAPWGEGQWLLTTADGRHAVVGDHARTILCAVRETRENTDAYARYCADCEEPLDRDEFEQHASRLVQTLTHSDSVAQRGLSASRTLLSAPTVTKIARFAAPVFAPGWAVLWAVIAVVSAGLIGWHGGVQLSSAYPSGALFLSVALAMLVTGFVHEIGHAAAALRRGSRPGPIGVGLFLVFPVFWSDLNATRTASRTDRLWANAGGILLQWLVAAGVYVLARQLDLPLLEHAATAAVVMGVWQLLPLLRNDGYWLLADATSLVNLAHGQALHDTGQLRPVAGWRQRFTTTYRYLNGMAMGLATLGLAWHVTILGQAALMWNRTGVAPPVLLSLQAVLTPLIVCLVVRSLITQLIKRIRQGGTAPLPGVVFSGA